MNNQLALAAALLLFNAVSMASPTVIGNTISWPANGWYQVQDESNYSQICSGGTTCDVEPGSYLVINHSTGERFPGINVGEPSLAVIVTGNTISWPDDGWYQVQDADTYESACEGGQSCDVAEGIYVVINHTTGSRYDGIVVRNSELEETEITVIDNVISLNSDGWIEVQLQSDYSFVCQGSNSCVVPEGIYTVINHTTGLRYPNIDVFASGGDDEDISPTIKYSIVGTSYSWIDNGFYQVQRSDNFATICEGGSSCSAPPGSYIVVNQTTGNRYENIVVNAITEDNLFFAPEDEGRLNNFLMNLSKLLQGDVFEEFLASARPETRKHLIGRHLL